MGSLPSPPPLASTSPPPPPSPTPAIEDRRVDARRQPILLPPHVARTICGYSGKSWRTIYRLAALFRLGDVGARALVRMSHKQPRLIFRHMDCLPFLHHQNALPTWFHAEFFPAACEAGQVAALQWAVDMGLPFEAFTGAGPAIRHGQVAVLDWLQQQSWCDLKSINAMDLASLFGHTNVLQWWKDSGLDLSYTKSAMDDASGHGHLDVLQWWLDSGLPLRYSATAMNVASGKGDLAVLQWWRDSGLELQDDRRAIDRCGHVAVLQWWKDSGLELRYEHSMALASQRGSFDVLQWWKDSGLPLRYEGAVVGASMSGRIDVLQWWKDSGLTLDYSEKAFRHYRGGVDVLQWWMESGLPLKKPLECVVWARNFSNEEAVRWWRESGLLHSLRDEIPLAPLSQQDKNWILQLIAEGGQM
ncbi:hypothetical protein DFJ73DRAFT_134197 [Zopfochytrium polystomum]|nr:hypothetical protein DFJ73DRAFT_134197 [Zopfochytrium polystomum]